MKKIFTYLFFLILIGCKSEDKSTLLDSTFDVYEQTNHPAFVSTIEKAHKKKEFLSNEVVCFSLELSFNSRKSVMKVITTPTSSAIRVEKANGPTTVMKDGIVYTTADSTKWKSEQFGVYTYQYFFMAPYKLSDKGTIWKKMQSMKMEGALTNLAMLTFEKDIGDAPDDWYKVHSNPTSNLIEYVGYIVTGGGKAVEEAEKNARAIKYTNYQNLAGIPIARNWEFFNYSSEGIGEKVGEGILKNVEFMDLKDEFNVANNQDFHQIN